MVAFLQVEMLKSSHKNNFVGYKHSVAVEEERMCLRSQIVYLN